MKKHVFLSCICLLLLVSLVAVPVLAQTVTCPSSCSCLLPAEAKKLGYYGYCQGKQAVCGYDTLKNEKYCYTKTVTTTAVPQLIVTGLKPVVTTTKTAVTTTVTSPPKPQCPDGCTCLSSADGKSKGLPYCNGMQTPCGYNTDKTTQLYCFSLTLPKTETIPVPETGLHAITTTLTPVKAATQPCTAGCSCLAADKADAAGLAKCSGTTNPCSYDPLGRPMYCFVAERATGVSPVPVKNITTVPALDITYDTVPPLVIADTTTRPIAPLPEENIFSPILSFFASLFGGGTVKTDSSRPADERITPLDAPASISFCRQRYGLDTCNDACVDLSTDRQNCGQCGTACYTNEICCAGTCVRNTSSDNCGTCGNHCPEGFVCQNGRCDEWNCYFGNIDCDGVCVNILSDSRNCGSCGNTCSDHTTCGDGVCRLCPLSTATCEGDCVFPSTDRSNCGTCRNTCAEDAICSEGTCVTCSGGSARCGNTCVNLETDNANCGTCGHACAEGLSCINGDCQCPGSSEGNTACWRGATYGGWECVDSLNDEENCGGCGRRCDDGFACCNGTCSALWWDRLNCGACGNACPDDRALGAADCRANTCTYCDPGRFGCVQPNGRALCLDIMTSESDCGDCGNQCADDERCCNGICTDRQDDRQNCGACGNACLNSEMCCDGVCTNVLSDENNCGVCNRVCIRPDREHCFGGRCCDAFDINCE